MCVLRDTPATASRAGCLWVPPPSPGAGQTLRTPVAVNLSPAPVIWLCFTILWPRFAAGLHAHYQRPAPDPQGWVDAHREAARRWVKLLCPRFS